MRLPILPSSRYLHFWLVAIVLVLGPLMSTTAAAMPVFARQYDLTCATCHHAFPRLNEFGHQFQASNYRLPNWREKTTADIKDEMLALPRSVPLALRMQAFAQYRQAREINDTYTGFTENNGEADFQAPYLIKLLSSAPLTDHISYYFYGIFAEKGTNGEAIIEDAWFRHDDAFGSGIGTQFGQFQVSDLMFPRETRMTFQDFMAYRLAGITYDRGIVFDRSLGPVTLAIGAVNGNGIEQNFNINSPGYQRADKMFDNDSGKSAFGRLGLDAGWVHTGVFGFSGTQKSRNTVANPLGTTNGTRDTDKKIIGLDVSGSIAGKFHWFAQALWNRWDGFLDSEPTKNYRWFGGFAGFDYIHNDRWAFSLLYNYADAHDFENTATLFKGININTLTATAAYYFMRNVKGVIELNGDFQKETTDFTAHPTKEGYALVGLDAAF